MRYLIVALLALPGVATAADAISGPIVAAVIGVYDGDTLTVNAYPWPNITLGQYAGRIIADVLPADGRQLAGPRSVCSFHVSKRIRSRARPTRRCRAR